jgi:Zn-dependent peptidase ImmA (M78 family)/DNA-binding XRE family transcriptional regulator
LTLARKRRGLTKGELATNCMLSSKSISLYEGGKTEPEPETITRLAAALRFPENFFRLPEPPSLDQERVSFRSLRSMTAWQRGMVISAGEMALELDRWIDRRFDRPKPDIPAFRTSEPEVAAEELRAEWGLGYRRIPNLIHLLELHGVRVYSLVHDSRSVDAFSFWWGEVPFMFLNTMKTAEHSRFDAAHELGHLLLHRHGGPTGREAEAEADKFAAAFLMPRSDVIARAPRWPTEVSIIKAKHLWGVSAMALIYRLHTVGILGDYHYQRLCIAFRSKYRSTEPEEMPRESSQMLAKVLESLRMEGMTRRDIARDLNINPEDVRESLFGLALQTMAGGAKDAPRSAARLKAI